MSEKLLIESSPIETRIAQLKEGRLEAFHIIPAGSALMPGAPVAGRIRSTVPALEAAFVDIGLGQDAFLPVSKARLEGLGEGDPVLASLAHLGVGDKGARLTREVSLPGRGLVLLVGGNGVHTSRQLDEAARERLTGPVAGLVAGFDFDRDRFGLIVRTEAAILDDDTMADEFAALIAEAKDIEAKNEAATKPGALLSPNAALALFLRGMNLTETDIVVDSAALAAQLEACWQGVRPDLIGALQVEATRTLMDEAGVEEAVERLLGGRFKLASGGEIVIEPTEALTAIDVNTGETTRHKGAGGNKASRALATNLEAADEIARVLRAANIGGLIAIDFLKMSGRSDETRVIERLQRGVAGDASAVRIGEFSKLGLVDLSRARRGPSLFDTLGDHTGGVRLCAEAIAARAVRLALRAAEAAPGRNVICETAPDIDARIRALRDAAKSDMMGSFEARVLFQPREGFARDRIETRIES